jgi:DNA polymerase III subunit alpha
MCVHLHVHSEYSTLDGLSTVESLIQRAKEIGSPALAITDHGVCGAIPDFITACVKHGVKPLPGCEAYMTKDRLKKGEFLKEFRQKLIDKYGISDKALKAFIRHIERHPDDFEPMASDLLKDYLMSAPDDLFTMAGNKLDEFRNELYEYMEYDNYHIVLIAMNNKGLEDLYEIVSDAHINGFYSNPRTDLSFIRSRNLGANIIATSACLGSYFARLALAGRMEEAKAFIQECKETFHSFYLEKQATRLPDQIKLNAIIDQLAKETNTPKIVTTDVHYANKDDHQTHDILVAASMGKCIADEDRLTYAHEFWMKSEAEIREIIDDDEAIANTYKIAEMVNVTLPKEPLFPKFIIEDGDTAETKLEKTAWNGLFTYALKKPIDVEKYARQLKYELEVINKQGFADYFLIVSDFINWAKRNGYFVGPGRGSAAGALTSFVLGITTLDPIEWNLMFERFLNPERAGYPDIDIDFSYAGAKAVQEYLKEKYGHDRVAQIGTYGTLAARASIRLVGKTLGYSLTDQDKFAKAIPEKPGITLQEAFEAEPLVQAYARQWPDWWETAKALEGHVRSEGVHAGGIVLSPEPLTRTVPLRLDKEGLVTTQYDMKWIEKLLVKFDILKLDTLDLLKESLEYAQLIGKARELAGLPPFDIDQIDLNDPKIYEEVYNKLNLSGIFQCESDLFRQIIKEMKPTNVKDISVIVALGRPGPLDLIPSYIRRKWGLERVTYPYDSLEPVLKETYGIWVYQEQIMRASMILGGFTAGQSDMLRKGVAKKKHDLMNKWIDLMIYGSERYKEMRRELNAQVEAMKERGEEVPRDLMNKYDPDYEKVPYIEGAINKGYDEAGLLKIKEDWIKFGDYCFNYAHSACYAVLSVQTAWLKTYYPAEFMAALMTISGDKKDKDGNPKVVKYMKECEEMGIRILPPDINRSNDNWTPIANTDSNQESLGCILYGLASIAGISSKDIQVISKGRNFESFEDFLAKNETLKLNKTKVIALIKSGCFDRINPNRNLLLRNYMKYRGEAYDDIPAKTTKKNIIDFEREYLGTAVSVKSRWDGIPDEKEGVQITGNIIKFEPFTAKKTGQRHARMLIETAEDERNVMVFNWLLKDHEADLIVGRKVRIIGKKSKDDLLANKIHYIQAHEPDWDVEISE